MKVVLIEIWSHGGTAQYVAELAQGLNDSQNEGDEVHLLVPRNFVVPDSLRGCAVRVHKVLPELRGWKLGGKLGSAAGLSWLRLRQIARAVRFIRRVRPDVVHIFSISMVSRGLLRQIRQIGAKAIVTVHDLPRAGGGWSQAFYRLWSKHFTKADRLIVHGSWSLSQIESGWGEDAARRTLVMPFGLYDYGKATAGRAELRERFGLSQDAVVLLFFGNLRRNKGLELIIEALGQSNSRALHLLVAGQRPSQSEPSLEWYQDLARECGVENQCTWIIRFIENQEVADVFACSDVAVLPYGRSFAAQSSVLSVAAACDVPVLASDVGDIGATVRDYGLGLCLEPESLEVWAQALRDLGSGQLSWDERHGDDLARDASWSSIGGKLWALYAQTK